MQWLMRIVCLGYAVFLTLLLLNNYPERLIGMREGLPWVLRAMHPAAHVISFCVLAVLALTTRWPVPRWGIVLILAIYGGMTEIAQGFTLMRTPRWTDWFQDVIGIAAGAACCWAIAMLAGMYTGARRSQADVPSPSSEGWGGMQNVIQRSTVSERSWWN